MHLGDAELVGDAALRHVLEEAHVEDGPLAFGQPAQPLLGGLAVDDDVVGRIRRRAEGVRETVAVVPAESSASSDRVLKLSSASIPALTSSSVRPVWAAISATVGSGLPGLSVSSRRATPHLVAQFLDPAGHPQRPHPVPEVPLHLTGDGGHRVALEGAPREGSNRSIAFTSPRAATWRRSSIDSPRSRKRPAIRWAMGSHAVTSSSRTASRSGPSSSTASRAKRPPRPVRRRADASRVRWAEWAGPARWASPAGCPSPCVRARRVDWSTNR